MQRRQATPHRFDDRITAEKAKLEAQVAKLKPGPEKDLLLRKIRQLHTLSHINDWLSSPGLAPPN